MAERVPIWYDVRGGRSTSAETYPTLQNAAAQFHSELDLSVAIAIAEQAVGEIKCVASSGSAAPPIGTKLGLEQGICAACVRQNRMQLSNDTAMHPMLSAELCGRLGMRSILAVPLRRDSTCVGFLAAFSDVAHRFDLPLIERIRVEVARMEGLLTQNATLALSASPHAISRDFDFQFGREAPTEHFHGASVHTDHRPPLAYSRPVSIAVLAFWATAIVAVAPRVVRSKTSIAHREVTATSKLAAHVRQNEAAQFTHSTSTDDSKLRDLHQRANAGDVGAQISLAARYEKADGLERDPLKACVWYIIAGANGNLAAKDRAVQLSHRLPQFQIAEIRFNVAKMYMQGTGVKRDLVAAYSWLALAQAAGEIRAPEQQAKLEALMNREQVSDGLRRASDWLLAHQSAAGQHTRELAAIPRTSRSAMEKSR